MCFQFVLLSMQAKKRKPVRKNRLYLGINFDEAINLINSGVSTRQAGERCGVPEATLRGHLRGRFGRKIGRPTIMEQEDEKALVDYLVFMAECGYGLTRREVRHSQTVLIFLCFKLVVCYIW